MSNSSRSTPQSLVLVIVILEHSDNYINVISSGLKILNIVALKMRIFYSALLASNYRLSLS